MTIQDIHYDFKVKIDKVDSLSKKNFLANEIDWIVNEAIKIFVKQRYGQNNSKKQDLNRYKKELMT